MSRLPKPSGRFNSGSGIPRPVLIQHAKPPIGRQTAAPEGEARPSGSSPATSEMTETKSLRVPATGIRHSAKETQSAVQPSQPRSLQPARPSSTETKQVASKTKVTITKSTGEKKVLVKKEEALRNSDFKGKSKKSSSTVPIPSSSVLRKQVALHVKGQVAKAPMGSRVTAVATKKMKVPTLEKIMTPAGPQRVVQKIITEKRVERSKHGEIISRNIKAIETDPRTGETMQFEEELQQLNPDYPAREGPLKEIVTIVSEKDITDNFETRAENVVRETIKLDADVGIESAEVVRLVEEEKEDVENVLQFSPPDFANQAPALYPLRKRLHALRLSPENIVMLEQSVINPPVTADEALPERTPELMARVMDTSANAYIPNTLPERIFNSLFASEVKDDPVMIVSSATPGPLGDVVVPAAIPEVVHEEMLSTEMEQASMIVQTALVKPPKDNFVEVQPTKPRTKARRVRRYTSLALEDPPWENEDIQMVITAVGALPKINVIATDIEEAERSGTLNKALVRGIEYVLDADHLQYCSKVQLRGTQPPPWFPGYMMALSDTSNIVGIAKSPSQVLFSAWKSVQPDVFPDDSILYN